MSLSIADLRALRSKGFGQITEALNKKSEYARDDENYFKLVADKAGNASAVLRFLPKHADDELPWVTYFSHGFQGDNGKWLIDNCPSTLGNACPVCEATRKLYQGTEADKKIGAKRKRRTHYVSNVMVVSDPKNPDNNGKVMPFKYGKKIFDKIQNALQPTFEDDKPVNVFDLWEGANFKLRMAKVEGFPNYDQSTWESPSEIAKDEDRILEIMNSVTPLAPILAPSLYKSYDELAKKLAMIDQDGAPTPGSAAEKVVEQMRAEPQRKAKKADAPAPIEEASAPASDGDEDLTDYFKSLTN
jgi:hypothetical protein